MTLQSVDTLLRNRREEITDEICKNYVEHFISLLVVHMLFLILYFMDIRN